MAYSEFFAGSDFTKPQISQLPSSEMSKAGYVSKQTVDDKSQFKSARPESSGWLTCLPSSKAPQTIEYSCS